MSPRSAGPVHRPRRQSSPHQIRRVGLVAAYAGSIVEFRGHLIQGWCTRGLEVFVFAPDHDDASRRALERIGATAVDYPLERTGLNPFRDIRTTAALLRAFDRLQLDAVFAYTVKPIVYGMLAARRAHVRRRFAMVTGRGSALADGTPGRRRPMKNAMRRLVKGLYRLALLQAEVVYFQNEDDQSLFIRDRLVSVDKAIRVWGSGVDLTRYEPAPVPGGQLVFLMVARLLRAKGVVDFAEAARLLREQYPDARFVLLGDVDANPDSVSRTTADRWVAEGILEWPGRVDDVRPWLRESSVFVLPSYYPEGVPRSILEALAMQRAVITTDSPGCRDTVVDGVNGFLVPARSPSALARSMSRFVEDPELAATMGAQSRLLAEQRFGVETVTADILEGMHL